MINILIPGAASSALLKSVKAAAKTKLGTDAAGFSAGFDPNTSYDEAAAAAIRAVQGRAGLVSDGIVGPLTLETLGLDAGWAAPFASLSTDVVRQMFPFTRRSNIERNLPYVLAALRAAAPAAANGVVPIEIALSALATIRAEAEGFMPISEMISKFNTAPGGPPFGLYASMLGNRDAADGKSFCGRGFVQLTGRVNYTKFSPVIGLNLTDPSNLVSNPDLANQPEIAAALLAAFVAACATRMLAALKQTPPDFKSARKLVNGGSHGLDRYTEAYQLGMTALRPVASSVAKPLAARGRKSAAGPAKVATKSAPTAGHRNSTRARRDPLDLRDRLYQPRVQALPASHPAPDTLAHHLRAYTNGAKLILDQGVEGSCTGHGLACVVNFQRWLLAGEPAKRFESVSPQMLYEMARRYDEYEGENYEGSSCRGAIRGFHQRGVCSAKDWPTGAAGSMRAADWDQKARDCTLGVYYRIDTKVLTDMQAAIVEAGAVFVSIATHDGWDKVPTVPLTRKTAAIQHVPDITWPATADGGAHAFALVGFDAQGFIMQNSWGTDWGVGGFARLSYADWLTNAMDAWVLSLGVPGVLPREVALKVRGPRASMPSSLTSSTPGDFDARRYTVEMGNDGRVDSFYGDDESQRKLDYQASQLPAQWLGLHSKQGAPWNVAIYAHGGLTSLDDALRKTAVIAPYFIGNGIYPLFLGWKTGGIESGADILQDGWNALLHKRDARAGKSIGDALRAYRDQAIEDIARGPVRALWSQMKQNAQRAAQESHGLDLLANALKALAKACPTTLNLHLIGHSAGSILHGYLLDRLLKDGVVTPAGIHLYAPACTVEFANLHYGSMVDRTWLHLLSDRAEQADSVTAAYGKSLLFLVANALESDRRTPIFGMARSFDPALKGSWNGLSNTLEALNQLQQQWPLSKQTGQHPQIQLYDSPIVTYAAPDPKANVTESPNHGGFDNDVQVLTRVLTQILGSAPAFPVLDLRQA